MNSSENTAVLHLVHAMIGSISSKFRRISLCADAHKIHIQFVLSEDLPEEREEISDILLVFESLYEREIEMETKIIVATQPLIEIPSHKRVVFAQREILG